MNFWNFLKKTCLIGTATLLCSAPGYAFDLSILKNEKEAKTHAYNLIEKNSALKKSSSISNQSFSILGDTFNELEKAHTLCDLPVYKKFVDNLAAANLPNSPKAVLNLLIVWRNQNLIDDLFFEIMEQSSILYAAKDETLLIPSKRREIKSAQKILATKEITDQDLVALYDSFIGTSINNPGCTAAGWTRTSQQLASVTKGKNTIRLMNVIAHEKNIITDEVFELVEFYRVNQVQLWDINLAKYLDISKLAKNSEQKEVPAEADLKPNSLSSKIKDKKTGNTYRQNLYYRFNSTQIGMISDLLKKTFDRMDATKTEVVFTFKEGSETLPVSPMGQYFLARKLLLKDMQELSRTSFFGGTAIAHEDLVTAALETGLINADLLDSVLKIDDLWNPEVKPWKKVADYAMRVTGTATIFLPPPYNVISSIAIVFIDGFINRKSRKTSQADNSYDFF